MDVGVAGTFVGEGMPSYGSVAVSHFNVMETERGAVSIGNHEEVVTLPMGLVLEVVGTLGLLTALALVGKWRCGCRRWRVAREAEELAAKVVERKKAKSMRRLRRAMREAGVQGLVHYTGAGRSYGGHYQHIVQGFRRGDEVTRLGADRPYAE